MIYIIDELTDTLLKARDEQEALAIIQRRLLNDEKTYNTGNTSDHTTTTTHGYGPTETTNHTTYGYN